MERAENLSLMVSSFVVVHRCFSWTRHRISAVNSGVYSTWNAKVCPPPTSTFSGAIVLLPQKHTTEQYQVARAERQTFDETRDAETPNQRSNSVLAYDRQQWMMIDYHESN